MPKFKCDSIGIKDMDNISYSSSNADGFYDFCTPPLIIEADDASDASKKYINYLDEYIKKFIKDNIKNISFVAIHGDYGMCIAVLGSSNRTKRLSLSMNWFFEGKHFRQCSINKQELFLKYLDYIKSITGKDNIFKEQYELGGILYDNLYIINNSATKKLLDSCYKSDNIYSASYTYMFQYDSVRIDIINNENIYLKINKFRNIPRIRSLEIKIVDIVKLLNKENKISLLSYFKNKENAEYKALYCKYLVINSLVKNLSDEERLLLELRTGDTGD